MQWFCVFFWMTLGLFSQNCEDLKVVRSYFQKGVNKQELISMIKVCEASTCTKVIPYHAASLMKKAEFVWSPLDKLSTFKKGKRMLESFIKQHPTNIEAKYIRWLTQKMAPSFLGYQNNLDMDYQYILNNISKSDIEKSYQTIILNHLNKIQHEQ